MHVKLTKCIVKPNKNLLGWGGADPNILANCHIIILAYCDVTGRSELCDGDHHDCYLSLNIIRSLNQGR